MRAIIVLAFLGLTGCEAATIEETPEMSACVTRGTVFYQRAPNFPYVENTQRVKDGYTTLIEDLILDTCSRSTAAYSGATPMSPATRVIPSR